MKLRLTYHPVQNWQVSVPSGKSQSHRALITAALADGCSRLEKLPDNEDIRATLRCLEQFGADFAFSGEHVIVHGTGGHLPAGELHLDCGASGATLRFMIALAGIRSGKTIFTGTERLLARPLAEYEELFARQGLQFENVGVDIKHEPIEVAPTAHHFMGGLKIDTDGSTSIKNLFGAGEVCGGVHGANRLGGNALADTQVFGKISGESASKACKNTELKTNEKQVKEEASRIENLVKEGSIKPKEFKNRIKKLMWEKVSIVRDEKTLNEALKELLEMQKELDNLSVSDKKQYNTDLVNALEVINMVEICILSVKSAILRRESRGAHFRSDFPETNDEWKRSIIVNQKEIKFEAR